jgi:hypothetical protein
VVSSIFSEMLDSQQRSVRRFSLVIVIITWIIVTSIIVWLLNSPFGLRPYVLFFLLLVAIAPVLFMIFATRSQESHLTMMKRTVQQFEVMALPKECPKCGGTIDLDEVELEERDVNCPYCSARLR